MAKQDFKPGNMLYPTPVVLVSCKREKEKPNIITVAWAGTICSSPPMVSISIRPERYSYSIIEETGEFVINLTTRKLAFATDFCGVRSGREIDKFSAMKLTPVASKLVKAPKIAESPVSMECKVVEKKQLGSHTIFLAEVVQVGAEEEYIDEKGRFHLEKADLLAYSHGSYYTLGKRIGTFGYSVRKKKNRGKKESG